MSSPPSFFLPDVTLLMGPLLLGYLFGAVLSGILVCQVYIYNLKYPNDRISTQCLVYTLLILDAIQSTLTAHNAWHFLSAGWGNPEIILDPGWSWIAVPLFTALISCPVHFFYAWRIWNLWKSRMLFGAIVSLSLVQGIAAIIYGIRAAILDDMVKILGLFPIATVWRAGSAAVNLVIAISMITLLWKAPTTQRRTDRLFTRVIRFAVETGAITAVASIVELALFVQYQLNLLYMIPALGVAKLYTNTLLCTLNSRNSTSGGGGLLSGGRTTSCGCGRAQSGTGSRFEVNSGGSGILVSREIETHVAMDDITKDPVDDYNLYSRPQLEASNSTSWGV